MKNNWLELNKNEILLAIITTQNDLQRAVVKKDLNEEHRLLQALIHLKETLFEINLKEYQQKHSKFNNTKPDYN